MILHRVLITGWEPLKQREQIEGIAACQNSSKTEGGAPGIGAVDPEQLYLYQGGSEEKAEAIFSAIALVFSAGFEGPARLSHDTLESHNGLLRLICRSSCELDGDGRIVELLHPTPAGARTR